MTTAGIIAFSKARSHRIRSAVLEAAKEGLSNSEIKRRVGTTKHVIGEVVTALRLLTMPVLTNHQVTVDGVTYLDCKALAEKFALSEVRIRSLTAKHGLRRIAAINPATSRINYCYPLDEVRRKLPIWSSRLAHLTRYRELQTQWKVATYPDLTRAEMATYLALVTLLRENGGLPPSYPEIEEVAGIGSRKAIKTIKALEEKGYLVRNPVYNPRRGQPSFRYLICKAPARLVTRPVRCPDCTGTIWVPFDWYQPRNGNGTAH